MTPDIAGQDIAEADQMGAAMMKDHAFGIAGAAGGILNEGRVRGRYVGTFATRAFVQRFDAHDIAQALDL